MADALQPYTMMTNELPEYPTCRDVSCTFLSRSVSVFPANHHLHEHEKGLQRGQSREHCVSKDGGNARGDADCALFHALSQK